MQETFPCLSRHHKVNYISVVIFISLRAVPIVYVENSGSYKSIRNSSVLKVPLPLNSLQ